MNGKYRLKATFDCWQVPLSGDHLLGAPAWLAPTSDMDVKVDGEALVIVFAPHLMRPMARVYRGDYVCRKDNGHISQIMADTLLSEYELVGS
jgi:hypothetical protein